VGQHLGVKALHRAWPLAEASRLHTMLDTELEHDLHPHADAQDRAPSCESPVDDHISAYGTDAGHARRESTDTGDDQAVALDGRVDVARDDDLGTDSLECALRGTEIA